MNILMYMFMYMYMYIKVCVYMFKSRRREGKENFQRQIGDSAANLFFVAFRHCPPR